MGLIVIDLEAAITEVCDFTRRTFDVNVLAYEEVVRLKSMPRNWGCLPSTITSK